MRITLPIMMLPLLVLGCSSPVGSRFVDVTPAGVEPRELAEICQSAKSVDTYPIEVGRETALRLSNDGVCAFSLFLITGPDGMAPERRSYDAAVLVDQPRVGQVKFVATESATWIEYIPEPGFSGADYFSFRLLPGGGIFPVTVDVVVAPEVKAPIRPAPSSALVQFEFGLSQLSHVARLQLDRLGAVIKDPRFAQWKIDLAGHTDASGAEAYNQRLSERRAMAVRGYLIDVLGVDAARINAAGYGPTVPLLKDRPLDAINRRVHLTFRRSTHSESRPRP